MFNEMKIQLEVCKALSKGNLNVSYAVIDDEHLVVSYDNATAFIIRRDNLIFNLKALKRAEILKYMANAGDLIAIRSSDRLCKINGILCREIEYGESFIYAAEKHIEMFKSWELYFSPEHNVFVGKTQGDAVIGFFLRTVR